MDGFEAPSHWHPSVAKTTEVVLSDDKTQGKSSERLAWAALPSSEIRRTLPDRPAEPFRKEDYARLKIDVKYVGARPYAHIRGLGKQVDLGDQLLIAELAAAKAEQRGSDAYGRVEYRSYITPDTKLTRHLVLTAEGYLVVHDVLTPGESMKGWNAGQLWQLYEMKAKGADWYCADDDGAYSTGQGVDGKTSIRRMLVRFATTKETQIGVEEIKQGYSCANPKGRPAERFFTTFCQRKIAPGQPEAFSLAVLPHDPAEGEPAAVAERARIEHGDGQGVKAYFRNADRRQTVEVTIGAHGWKVAR